VIDHTRPTEIAFKNLGEPLKVSAYNNYYYDDDDTSNNNNNNNNNSNSNNIQIVDAVIIWTF
jgi:hypothetical protein